MTGSVHFGIARLVAKPGHADEFERGLVATIPDVRRNPENYQFEVYRSALDPQRFLLLQTFADDAAWERHRTSEAVINAFKAGAPFMDGPPERTVWRPLADEPPTAPAGSVASAVLTTVRVPPPEQLALARWARAEWAAERPGLLMVDVAVDASDPEHVLFFSRWSVAAPQKQLKEITLKRERPDEVFLPSSAP